MSYSRTPGKGESLIFKKYYFPCVYFCKFSFFLHFSVRSMIVYLGHLVLVREGKMVELGFHFVCYYASATGQYNRVPKPYSLRSAKLRVSRPVMRTDLGSYWNTFSQ